MSSIIITGSEGFLGNEMACYFEAQGASVFRCSRSLGHDLENEQFVKDWFEQNRADHLVNLFALNEHIENQTISNLFNCSLDSVRQFLEINVVALFSVCREYARHNKAGNIVNFSSIYGKVSPDPGLYEGKGNKHIGYVTSKAAVMQLSKYLAVHLAPEIRVNCVVPGGVLHKQNEEFINNYSNKTPLNRMMHSDEIIGIVSYLCSEASSYTTGGEFIIDGGYSAW